MKKIAIILSLLCIKLSINAQNLNIISNSTFRPLSYEELLIEAQIEAERNAYKEQKFNEYSHKAYALLNKGDKHGFITYSNYALQTGWYNTKLYYDRGRTFQSLGDYKNAKKEYKKAKKKGYYPAELALQELKTLRKRKY